VVLSRCTVGWVDVWVGLAFLMESSADGERSVGHTPVVVGTNILLNYQYRAGVGTRYSAHGGILGKDAGIGYSMDRGEGVKAMAGRQAPRIQYFPGLSGFAPSLTTRQV